MAVSYIDEGKTFSPSVGAVGAKAVHVTILLQLLNAPSPMLCTPSGMVISVILYDSAKASLGISTMFDDMFISEK